MLLTKYLSAVKVSIPVYNRRAAKSTRLFLSLLVKESARQGNTIKLDTKFLDESDASSSLNVVYKDNRTIDFQPDNIRIASLVESVNMHSKALALKEQVS